VPQSEQANGQSAWQDQEKREKEVREKTNGKWRKRKNLGNCNRKDYLLCL
jgi:hypothetical protein